LINEIASHIYVGIFVSRLQLLDYVWVIFTARFGIGSRLVSVAGFSPKNKKYIKNT
jgi:hypothetical protein